MRKPVVAIDGPAGSGKSTVARMLAERLGYAYVDTGALYRCVALAVERAALRGNLEEEAGSLARGIEIAFKGPATKQRVLLDGEDVSEAIRTPEISMLASRVSAIPSVRSALLDQQRRLAKAGGAVLEGRDIGTVVLPNAEVKFFLTASAKARAERRYKELVARGVDTSLDKVRSEQEERDRNDAGREIAPLKAAPDAEIVDTSDMTVLEVIEHLERRVRGLG